MTHFKIEGRPLVIISAFLAAYLGWLAYQQMLKLPVDPGWHGLIFTSATLGFCIACMWTFVAGLLMVRAYENMLRNITTLSIVIVSIGGLTVLHYTDGFFLIMYLMGALVYALGMGIVWVMMKRGWK